MKTLEPLKKGDRVVVTHVENNPYGGWPYAGTAGEVAHVDGVYVQVFFATAWPRTQRYHATSVASLSYTEILLRPAVDATTPGRFGRSIRIRRAS